MELLGDVGHVESRFFPFGEFWFWLGDMGHVESHFIPFGDNVSVSARWVHGLCKMYQRLTNRFGRTRWNS